MNKNSFITTGTFKVSDNSSMFCPICEKKLTHVGDKDLYTAISSADENLEHVNIFHCSNKNCDAFGNFFWDEHGDIYTYSEKRLTKNSTAYNSLARKCSVEIYKKDENFTVLNLYFFKIECEYKYESDYLGAILKRRRKFNVWINNRNGGGYTLYISGIHMFFFSFKQFGWILNRLKENRDNEYVQKELLAEFEDSWDRRWWKVLYKKIIRIKHKKLYIRNSMSCLKQLLIVPDLFLERGISF